jgi:N6-L-threonylcarbamoyladenine synthase
MQILGIESSCDDTGVAVVEDGRWLRASVVYSSMTMHERFGGIVPELASREHVVAILPAVQQALADASMAPDDIDVIAVTKGPGLLGSLLVGVTAAKSLALALKRPLVGVHHLEAHLYANAFIAPVVFPAVALLVSGGHTALYRWEGHGRLRLLGETVDDAAGEALDKGARTLGLSYPGGPAIEQWAMTVSHAPHTLPIPRVRRPVHRFDMSFSGLKTALAEAHRHHPDQTAELSYALEVAVVEALVEKTVQAAQEEGVKYIYLAGGVSANQRLCRTLRARADTYGIAVYAPRRQDATDNGAMVAAAGYYHWQLGHQMDLSEGPQTPYPLGEE